MYLVLCNSLLEKRNRKREKKRRIWLEERQEKRVWWRHREMDEPGGTQWCKVRLEEKRPWRRPLELKPQTCPWLLTWAVCGSKLSLLFERQGCWAVTRRYRLSNHSRSGPDTWESPRQLCVDWWRRWCLQTQASLPMAGMSFWVFCSFLRAQATLPSVLASQEFLGLLWGGFFMLEGLAKSDHFIRVPLHWRMFLAPWCFQCVTDFIGGMLFGKERPS